jgi:hypothetical protein
VILTSDFGIGMFKKDVDKYNTVSYRLGDDMGGYVCDMEETLQEYYDIRYTF